LDLPQQVGRSGSRPPPQLSEAAVFRLEEQLLHRVVQRIDDSFEARVSGAVSAAVARHLEAMMPGARKLKSRCARWSVKLCLRSCTKAFRTPRRPSRRCGWHLPDRRTR
jgi:hypothetical protein